MKLHAERDDNVQLITAHGPGWVAINHVRHEGSLILMPSGVLQPWTGAESFEHLSAQHFEQLLTHEPEFVIFGTGPQLRFPSAQLTAALTRARIGVECMDTAAACRTFNVLALEGRQMLAALLL